MTRKINEKGLELIKSFESLSLTPYQDEKGIFTIGYGHTHGVTSDTPTIDEDEANALLEDDLDYAENAVCKYVRATLSDNQFSALVSLVFNCGIAPLTHTLGAYLNTATYDKAADEFLKWDKEHIGDNVIESNGLLKRRQAERALFLS